jgi:predicted lipoprotein with Yx(FWY)xxD motif
MTSAQGSPAQAATPTTTTTPASNEITILESIGPARATGKTVSLAKGTQGIFLVGPHGRTLYIYSKDHGVDSACRSAACAKAWPALTARGRLTFGPGIDGAQVKTVRGQVMHQVSYYGHLLYYFKGDAAPGQTKGALVTGFDLLGPFGNVMLPKV